MEGGGAALQGGGAEAEAGRRQERVWCWGTREDLEILRLIFLLFLILHGLLSLMHAKTRQRSDQDEYGRSTRVDSLAQRHGRMLRAILR